MQPPAWARARGWLAPVVAYITTVGRTLRSNAFFARLPFRKGRFAAIAFADFSLMLAVAIVVASMAFRAAREKPPQQVLEFLFYVLLFGLMLTTVVRVVWMLIVWLLSLGGLWHPQKPP